MNIQGYVSKLCQTGIVAIALEDFTEDTGLTVEDIRKYRLSRYGIIYYQGEVFFIHSIVGGIE